MCLQFGLKNISTKKKHIGLCNREKNLCRALSVLQKNVNCWSQYKHHYYNNELQENVEGSNNEETTITHLDEEVIETQIEVKPSKTPFDFQSMIQEYIQKNNHNRC